MQISYRIRTTHTFSTEKGKKKKYGSNRERNGYKYMYIMLSFLFEKWKRHERDIKTSLFLVITSVYVKVHNDMKYMINYTSKKIARISIITSMKKKWQFKKREFWKICIGGMLYVTICCFFFFHRNVLFDRNWWKMRQLKLIRFSPDEYSTKRTKKLANGNE